MLDALLLQLRLQLRLQPLLQKLPLAVAVEHRHHHLPLHRQRQRVVMRHLAGDNQVGVAVLEHVGAAARADADAPNGRDLLVLGRGDHDVVEPAKTLGVRLDDVTEVDGVSELDEAAVARVEEGRRQGAGDGARDGLADAPLRFDAVAVEHVG